MIEETYKRIKMEITQFDVEDIITTSGMDSDGNTPPDFNLDPYEDIL